MLRWKYFGPILYVSKTFSEFKMKCELIGYGGYASGWDEENDIKCYESFIFAEACGWRGKGIMNKKAAMFRDEMVKYHIKQKNIRGDVWKNHKRNIESETTQAEIS